MAVVVSLPRTKMATERETSPLIYFCESSPKGMDHGNQE